jgi:hypothetical protein
VCAQDVQHGKNAVVYEIMFKINPLLDFIPLSLPIFTFISVILKQMIA